MTVSVCSATRAEITAFPGGGTLNDYLEENGMYPSSTYLYLRTKPRSLGDFIAEVDGWCSDSSDNSSSAPTKQTLSVSSAKCVAGLTKKEETASGVNKIRSMKNPSELMQQLAAFQMLFLWILCLDLQRSIT